MQVADLKKYLKDRGLSDSGLKGVLAARLKEAIAAGGSGGGIGDGNTAGGGGGGGGAPAGDQTTWNCTDVMLEEKPKAA